MKKKLLFSKSLQCLVAVVFLLTASSVNSQSIDFSGTNSYLTMTSDPSFTINAGEDYTIEWYMKIDPNSYRYCRLFSFGNNQSISMENWQGYASTNSASFFYARNGTSNDGLGSISGFNNTWKHMAIVRYNGVIKVYVDGRYSGVSVTDNGAITGGDFYLGALSGGNNVKGKFTHFRFTKSAIYTSNFTPPVNGLTASNSILFINGGSDSTSMLSNSGSLGGTFTQSGATYSSDTPFPFVIPVPTITTSGTLNQFNTCSGTAPAVQSFTVSGTLMEAAITIAAPTGFEVSTSSSSGFGSSVTLANTATVASTTIYVRMTAASTGTSSGNISITSTNAATQTIAVSGTVTALPTITTQPTTPVNLCQNSSYTLGANATGASSYQWYSNTSNSNTGGTSLGSANFAQTGGLSVDTTTPGTVYYYLVASSGSCSVTSAVSAVTVNTTPVAGTASGAATICGGTTTGLSLTGHTGNIQWQQSANGTSGWANVTGGTGATTASYTTAALSATTYYKAVVTSGTCISVESNIIQISVIPASVAGTITASPAVACGSSPVTLTLSGYTGTIQWLRSASPIWDTLNGETNATYTTPSLFRNETYRAVVTSGACPSATTDITITYNIPPSGPTVANTTVNYCQGGTATALAATATSGYSLQWYTVASGGNASTTTPTPVTTTARQLMYYVAQKQNTGSYNINQGMNTGYANAYLTVTSSVGQTFTATSTSILNSISVIIDRVSGKSYQLKLYSGFGGSLVATSDNNVTGSTAKTVATFNFTNSNLTLNQGSTYYMELKEIGGAGINFYYTLADSNRPGLIYRDGFSQSTLLLAYSLSSTLISNPCESARTAITVTINPAPVGGTATAAASAVCSGATTTIALANSTGTIQWQQLVGTNWTDITGETSVTLTTPAITQTTSFRAKLSGQSCSDVYSNTVTVGVTTVQTFVNAMNLDGTNDYIRIEDNNALDFTNASNYTLEAWIYPRAFTWLGGIISKYNSNSANGYTLRSTYSGNNRGISFDGMDTADNILNANTWYHIAAVKNGSTRKLYVNGVEVPLTGTPTTIQANSDPVLIGKDFLTDTNQRFFNGDIDEVRIWNVARTLSDIQQTKDAPLVGNESGLVAYYDFNQGVPGGNNTTETSVTNRVSNSLHGTMVNIAKNGAGSNFVANSNSAQINGRPICSGTTTTFTHPVSGGTWSSATTSVATIDATGLVTGVSAGTSVISYSFTYNGCPFTQTYNLTVNLTPTISGAQTLFVGGSPITLTATGTPATTNPWTSSATGVATITSSGVITAVSSGTTTITYTNNSGCTATATVTITDCRSPLGNALNFDGSNDYVSIGDSLENLADVTQEAWIYWKGSSTNDFSEIFTKDLISAFAITRANKLHANFGNGSSWSVGLNSTTSIPLNTWTHVAVTRQNGVVKMFINGVEETTTATMAVTGQNSAERIIGGKLYNSTTSNTIFNGAIDELRFWSVAKTAAQIESSRYNQLVGNESNLVAYYNFNQGVPSGNNSAISSLIATTGGLNGTFNNMPRTTGAGSNFILNDIAIAISGSSTVCIGATIPLAHPITGGTWSVSSGSAATIDASGVVTALTAGNVTISYSYSINGCSFIATKSITVAANPSAPTVTSTMNFCQGGVANLTATASSGNTLKWYTVATGGTASTTAPIVDTTTLASTPYYVSQVTSTGCESPRATITATVNGLPAAPVAPTSVDFCQEQSRYKYAKVVFSDIKNRGYANSIQVAEWRWLNGNTVVSNANTTVTNPNGSNPYSEGPAGIYDGNVYSKWLDFSIVSSSSATSTIVFNFPGQGVTIDGYSWTTANDAEERDPKSWTVYGSNDGVNWSQIHAVTNFAVPSSRFTTAGTWTFGTTSGGNSNSTNLSATALTGHTLKWYTVATGGTGSTTVPVVDASIAGSTSYYVSQINTTTGCESSRATIAAVVNPIPVISGNGTIEVGAITTLTATTTPASSNAWVSSNTSVATVNASGEVTAVAIGSAVITFTNSTGCSTTKNITVTIGTTQAPVLLHPASNLTGATTFRVNYTLPEAPLAGSVRLTFTPVGGGTPIVWTMSNATSVDFNYTVTAQPNATYVTSGTALSYGTYNVTLSYQDAFGSPAASAFATNIQTLAPPSISFATTTYSTAVNAPIIPITPTNTGGVGTYSISPNLPTGLVFNTATGTISGTPTVILAQTTFTITATNAAGSDSKTIQLTVDADSDGDGVPDAIEVQQGTNPNTPGDALDTDGDGVPDYVEVQQGTNPTTAGALDTDGDGVPDYIEIQQGTSPTTPGARDTDGDGVPDYIEVQQGTSPTTPGARDTDGDGVPDYVEVQQGTNPTTPGALDTDGDGVPDYVEVQQGTSPTTPGARDTDGDGVPDYVELQQGTSPTTPGARDTDGDGIPDYIEVQQGTNPNQSGDTILDTDGDGIPDYVEVQQGTSPTTPGDVLIDTDGDGVPDYIEVQQGTSPTTPGARDTDGDGVPDYVEVQQGTNPNVPGARDTDGDGIPDYIEVQLGTNPNVADAMDSDNDGISNYNEGYNYTNPSASLDTDRDGTPNYLDLDSDGDSVLDRNDAFPVNRLEWKDTDHDGTGDNADTDDDNDGILDSCDADVNGDGIIDNGTDLDRDGIIDGCDADRDGDGVNNTSDNCPDTANANQSDRDHDGLGDVCDTIELNVMQGLTPNGDGINDTWVIYNIENHPGTIVRVFNTNGAQVYYSANYQNNWTGNLQGSSEMLPTGSYMYQVDLGGDGTIDSQGWLYITK